MKPNGAGKLFFLVLLVFCTRAGHSQVIISLLLGDKLNSGKIEFGLEGGANFISQTGVGVSTTVSAFSLGFYFDIKMKGAWMLHTGVIVKSNMGAGGLPVYSLNNPDLDAIFSQGSVDRTLNYFNVPILLKYNFKNNFYVEAGPQLGLLYNGTDQFKKTINGQLLTYDVDVVDQYHRLDAGIATGIGYRLMGGNGMNLGARYYFGLVDVSKDGSQQVMNQSLYLTVGIPIGAGKAKAREMKEN